MGTSNHEVNEILAISGNNFCADCGCHSPRWASINLGVLVCINCSGVHRKLGVHISKIKSLTLDTLKYDWINSLKCIGNDIANAYYLNRAPNDIQKIRPGESAYKMEVWIRNKYEKKIYAATNLPEPCVLLAQGKDPRKYYNLLKAKSSKSNSDFVADFSNIKSLDNNSSNAPLIDLGSEDINFANFETQSHPHLIDHSKKVGIENSFLHAHKEANVNIPDLSDVYKIRDAKIEAAKACIAKMYKNPEQLGLHPDVNDVKPSCFDGSGNIDFSKTFQL